ncbi:DUF445 family protein [Paenibacillus sp. P25]|nr:DUF445 family protein [Paenibacillus sp. P25]
MSGNTKFTAAVSLGVMAAGFAATIPWSGQPWVKFLQNGFEAGLVGGLADWFAVTALFRHPLGIPIPHTALLPKNRERVTNALISSVEQDLLSKQSLKNKLADTRIAPLVLDARSASWPRSMRGGPSPGLPNMRSGPSRGNGPRLCWSRSRCVSWARWMCARP